MKIALKDFVPPILYRAFNGTRKTRAKPLFYSTYAEAQEACSGFGYEDDLLVRTVFEKTLRIKKQQSGIHLLPDYMVQFLLAFFISRERVVRKKRIGIIDFGGACGAHYFQVRRYLPQNVHVNWMIVETPAMVKKGSAFETDELHFFTSLSEAKEHLESVDLLYSSGAIQYVPAPEAVLKDFIDCAPVTIFLNRLALSSSVTMITTQKTMLSVNGPGPLPDGIEDRHCLYPITYFSKRQFERILSVHYTTKIEFPEVKASVGGNEILVNGGLLAERTS